MSNIIHKFRSSTPPTITVTSESSGGDKKESKFKKFRQHFHRSSLGLNEKTNLSKKRSASTSALTQINSQSNENVFAIHRKRTSVVSTMTTVSQSSSYNSEESDEPTELPTIRSTSQPTPNRTQMSAKELIEIMITNLQILERKNEFLTKEVNHLSEEKLKIESDLSSTKVELNLFKNRLNQIETIADEWHCSLCLDNKIKIMTTKRVIMSTICGHLFCSLCAQSFINSSRPSKYCPICHKLFKDNQQNFHQIFL